MFGSSLPLPVRKTVGFCDDINWEAEEKKAKRGFERRQKAKQRRAQRREFRRNAKMNEEGMKFRFFLEFALTNEHVCELIHFRHLWEGIEDTQIVTKEDLEAAKTNADKLRVMVTKFDHIMNDKVLCLYFPIWMIRAMSEGLYSLPKPSEHVFAGHPVSRAMPNPVPRNDMDVGSTEFLANPFQHGNPFEHVGSNEFLPSPSENVFAGNAVSNTMPNPVPRDDMDVSNNEFLPTPPEHVFAGYMNIGESMCPVHGFDAGELQHWNNLCPQMQDLNFAE